MLSDEEKKAIEWLKVVSNVATNKYTMKQQWYLKIILNLIEKQSKEIEELKKEYERVRAGRNWLSEHISAQIATPELFDRLVEENYISKDKIKAKIDYLLKRYDSEEDFCSYDVLISILQSLLEEKE